MVTVGVAVAVVIKEAALKVVAAAEAATAVVFVVYAIL